MKGRVVLVVALCSLCAAGCGSIESGGSNCGPPYTVHVNDQTLLNSCAGVIPARPIRFSISVGGRFEIEIGHEESGALDFPVPEPAGTGIRRLSRQGASVTYEARSRGTSRLIAHHTVFCIGADPRIGSCTVAVIRITSS
jgi:hypothetical protein